MSGSVSLGPRLSTNQIGHRAPPSHSSGSHADAVPSQCLLHLDPSRYLYFSCRVVEPGVDEGQAVVKRDATGGTGRRTKAGGQRHQAMRPPPEERGGRQRITVPKTIPTFKITGEVV